MKKAEPGLPSDRNAELAVLRRCWTAPDEAASLVSRLDVAEFYYGDTRAAFQAISRLVGNANAITPGSFKLALGDDAKYRQLFVEVFGEETAGDADQGFLENNIASVKHRARQRQRHSVVTRLVGLLDGSDDESFREALDDLTALEREERALLEARGFTQAAEIVKRPPREHVVEDIVVRGGVSVLAADAGIGKSTLILGMGAAVSDASQWCGRDVVNGSVTAIAFEADDLSLRVQALQEHGFTLENLYILEASDPISPRVERDGTEHPSPGERFVADELDLLARQLAAEGKPPIRLISIDTVRASLHGSEDSSADVSAYLRAVRRILAPHPEAGALLAHHTGWQDGDTKRKRERGSSAFRGNVEITVFLEATDESDPNEVKLELKTLKARDSDKRVPLRLIRKKVDVLGLNKFGQPLSSCTIERDPRTYKEVVAENEAQKEAAAEAEDNALLKKLLSVVRDNEVTSLTDMRALVGGNRNKVSGALARAKGQKLIGCDKQRAPYRLTDAGAAKLDELETETHA